MAHEWLLVLHLLVYGGTAVNTEAVARFPSKAECEASGDAWRQDYVRGVPPTQTAAGSVYPVMPTYTCIRVPKQ